MLREGDASPRLAKAVAETGGSRRRRRSRDCRIIASNLRREVWKFKQHKYLAWDFGQANAEKPHKEDP
ncbi:hypothetical protein HispidOSU_016239 [Sigmodon hispidus]